MRYVILEHKHYLTRMGGWEYRPEINLPNGYRTYAEAEVQLNYLRNRPYKPDPSKKESAARPHYWVVHWGDTKHRMAYRAFYKKELEGTEGLPSWDWRRQAALCVSYVKVLCYKSSLVSNPAGILLWRNEKE